MGGVKYTSYFISGLHFGHWKAVTQYNKTAQVHPMIAQFFFQSG